MKLLLHSILTMVLLFGAARVEARLDETVAQCEARYGKPTLEYDSDDPPGSKVRVYSKNGLKVSITFVNGKAGYIIFDKLNKSGFSDQEIDTLTNVNRGSFSWKQRNNSEEIMQKDGKPTRTWDRSDGGAAQYSYSEVGGSRSLMVQTGWYANPKQTNTGPAQPKANGLDGF